jgi:3-hydroxyisobutyrate dehydrogenase-like beta-hydroxyacid dehydrogenase
MKLGFIGFGEVGSEMAHGLKGAGVEGIVAYDALQKDSARSGHVRERGEYAGVALLDSTRAVVEAVEILMVAVPGSVAVKASRELCPFLRPGMLYVDLTTATPDEKHEIDEKVRATGALFVDAAIMARLAIYQHKASIMASGNGADLFVKQLVPYGMQIEKVSEVAGDATAIKFVRSIFSKGFPALMAEVLEAAAVMKVEHLVLKSLAATMDAQPFEQVAKYHVTGSSIHAERHLHEMKSVVEMLESLHVNPAMTKATCERLQWLASMDLKRKFGDKPPEDWQEIVRPWMQARSAAGRS